ncbi:MAG: MFS transporter [Solirubrobacteraceae bacterium]
MSVLGKLGVGSSLREHPAAGTPPAARGAVTAVFAINGLLFGSWAARIPAIRDRAGLTDGELGVALACIAVGAIAAMPLAGAAGARFGSRRATRTALVLSCIAVGVVALAPSLLALAALTVFFGMAMGSLDVSMNAHGVAVESRYHRPILASFHAAFSLGGLAGGALGALAAAAGLDVRVHLGLAAAGCAVVGLLWSRRFLGADADAVGASEPTFVRPPARLLPLGALAFAGLLIEGASGDWCGVYLRVELGATAGVAALAFTGFSVTMTIGRLVGDRLVHRFGSTTVVRAGGAIAALGFTLALVASTPVAGIAGFACLGAGMSGIVPIVFRAAGHVPGLTAGMGLAAVSTTGYLGFLVGPPVIGGIAELVGLPNALVLLVLLGAVVFSLAPTTRRDTLATA